MVRACDGCSSGRRFESQWRASKLGQVRLSLPVSFG